MPILPTYIPIICRHPMPCPSKDRTDSGASRNTSQRLVRTQVTSPGRYLANLLGGPRAEHWLELWRCPFKPALSPGSPVRALCQLVFAPYGGGGARRGEKELACEDGNEKVEENKKRSRLVNAGFATLVNFSRQLHQLPHTST